MLQNSGGPDIWHPAQPQAQAHFQDAGLREGLHRLTHHSPTPFGLTLELC
jgi:hypothetical protein